MNDAKMDQGDGEPLTGLGIVARALEAFGGLSAVRFDAPRRDEYEPGFWYPGWVSFDFDESEHKPRLLAFFERCGEGIAAASRKEDFPMGLTIDLVHESNGKTRGVIQFYLHEECGGADDLDGRLSRFAWHLSESWKDQAAN